MAKVTLPLLGVRASGTIGDSVVFGNWKGINYARTHVVPANPNTTGQVAQRNLMSWVVRAWQYAPAAIQNGWIAAAKGTGLTGYNLFTRRQLLGLKGDTSIADFVPSPGQSGATNLSALGASKSGADLVFAPTVGESIPGTTITKVWFGFLVDSDPHGEFVPPFTMAEDTTSPYSATLTPEVGVGSVLAFAFTQCVDSKGDIKYGVPLTAIVAGF